MLSNIKWLVVPGGPGLSSMYLKNSLPNIFRGFDLHFYEPYGSPGSVKKVPTLIEMVEQLENEARHLNDVGLITHSFGNYLALRALERNHCNFKAIIMLNPIPFTSEEWKAALTRLVNQIPQPILHKINELSQSISDGSELFRLIYPFYVNSKKCSLPCDIPFSISSCNAISEQVETFDEHLLVENSNVPMVRIIGDQDVFYSTSEEMSDRTFVLKETGHYPFFEDQNQFLKIMPYVEEKLCQMMPTMT